MNPIRVQLSRKKGWKMPPNTIYVGRPTKWGNPYKVEDVGQGRAVQDLDTAVRERLLHGS
jgi:hypothetical protein